MSIFGRRPSGRLARRATVVAAVAAVVATAGLLLSGSGSAAASAVSAVSFTPTSNVAGASTGYAVQFTPATTFGNGSKNTITITFPSGFGVAGASVTLSSTLTNPAGDNCAVASSPWSGQAVTITLAKGGGSGNCSVPGGTSASISLSPVTNQTSAGTYTDFSVATSSDSAGTASVTIAPGTDSKLAFTTSPSSSTTAGVAFAAQPVVEVEDQYGNRTSSTASVTIAVTSAVATITCTGGTTVAATAGRASFTGCSITKAGTYTLTATSPTLTSATSAGFSITAAGASKLAFAQQPTDGFVGTAISPAVTVQVQDTYGNSVASSALAVTLTASGGSFTGLTANTDATGLATFSAVKSGHSVLSATLTAAASGLASATSNSFNVSVQVTSTANSLTDTVSDAGSGVASVSYYYCGGFTGACTSASGTFIGSSTTATGSYPVSWTTRPAAGPYRVIAVASDKVGNSTSTASTPVTVQ